MDEKLEAVLGDEMRVKYILLCLIQKASIRSSKNDVQVFLDITNNEALDMSTLFYSTDEKFPESAHLMISVKDSGPFLPEMELKNICEESVIKGVAKKMGGHLYAQ